jgi:hypothetical protein
MAANTDGGGIFIDDGRERVYTLKAVPGLHGEARIEFRPARSVKRRELAEAASNGPAKHNAYENRLLVAQKVRVNGELLTAGTADELIPNERETAINLVLGFLAADPDPTEPGGQPSEADELKN